MADECFKREDARSYDLAAETFDRLGARYSAPFADALVRIAGVAAGDRVLDLGAGTGNVAKRLVAAGASAIAADLSTGMLRVASRNSPVVRMDAEAFAIRPNSLDAVVSLFAVIHFPAPETVLETCAESLRPGGLLAFAYGSPVPWSMAALHAARHLADRVQAQRGRLLTAPQALDKRLPEAPSLRETPLARSGRRATRELIRLTRKAGFVDLQTGWMGRRFQIPSAEEFWELQAVYSSKARKALAVMDAPAHGRLRDSFLGDSQAVLDRGGSLIYPVGAAWIRAKKPLE